MREMTYLHKRLNYYAEHAGFRAVEIVQAWAAGFGLEEEVEAYKRVQAEMGKRFGAIRGPLTISDMFGILKYPDMTLRRLKATAN